MSLTLALVGHGKMGREVEAIAGERGHQLVIVKRGDAFPKDCAVSIDFSNAGAVLGNVSAALAAGARVVVGTTGWEAQRSAVEHAVTAASGGLVHAANFSLGVNLFYRLVKNAAALLTAFPDYDPYVLERHHRMKQDAPSGTAKALAAILEAAPGARKKAQSSLDGALPESAFHVAALRAGGIVGEHTVGFDSGGDEILLEHRARSRRGFALGSVIAAEWIATRTGFFSFDSVIEDLVK